MNDHSAILPGETGWDKILDQAMGRTTMLVGGPGSGKTRLAHWLASSLTSTEGPVALVSTDVGQQSVGVPTCLGLALEEPREHASALWFVGDVAPIGNLLPMVVGAACLVERARREGAKSIIVDTTGLVDAPLGCLLKYHKVLAAKVDFIVGLQRHDELERMLHVLAGICPVIERIEPAAEARDRTPAERRTYREERYRMHFREASIFALPSEWLITPDWAIGASRDTRPPLPGTVVGLLDGHGFCHALGLVEEARDDRLVVFSAGKEPDTIRRIQAGKVRLDRLAGFRELR